MWIRKSQINGKKAVLTLMLCVKAKMKSNVKNKNKNKNNGAVQHVQLLYVIVQ